MFFRFSNVSLLRHGNTLCPKAAHEHRNMQKPWPVIRPKIWVSGYQQFFTHEIWNLIETSRKNTLWFLGNFCALNFAPSQASMFHVFPIAHRTPKMFHEFLGAINWCSKIYEFIELPFNFHEFLFQSWLFRKFYKYYKFKQGFHDDKSLNLRCFRSKTIPTVGVSGCPSEVPLGVKSRTLDLGESVGKSHGWNLMLIFIIYHGILYMIYLIYHIYHI